jgi:hypothetical protein
MLNARANNDDICFPHDVQAPESESDSILKRALGQLQLATLELGSLFGLDELIHLNNHIGDLIRDLVGYDAGSAYGAEIRLKCHDLLESAACRLLDAGKTPDFNRD